MSPPDVKETYAKVILKAAALIIQEGRDVEVENNSQEGTSAGDGGNNGQMAAELPDTRENENHPSSGQQPKKRRSAPADLLGQTFKTTEAPLVSASSVAEKEIRQYQEAPPLPLTDDPLLWWKSQAPCYPLLAKLAQRGG